MSPDGVVTAVAQGSAVVTATIAGASATATITVTPPAVRTIVVSVANASMTAGTTQQPIALLRSANNQPITGRAVAWSSSAPTVATVNATTGAITALSAGSALVTATADGVSGAVQITVVAVPIATIAVSAPATTMVAGTTQAATAVLRDAANQVLTGRDVAWISPSPAIVSVNAATGVITAVAVGTSQIFATSEGVTGSITITVIAPVATVSVGLPSAKLATGVTQTATAVVRDAGNQALTGRAVAWSSTNASVASVNATTGVITGLAAGTTTIQATSEGRTGSTSLTVVQVPTLASLSPSVISALFNRVDLAFTGENFANDFISWTLAVGESDAITGLSLPSRPTSSTNAGVVRLSIADPSRRVDTYIAFARTETSDLVLGARLPIAVYPISGAPQTISSVVGGPGGTAFAPITCPAGTIATGLAGRAVGNLDQISLRCQSVIGTTRTFGGSQFTAVAGPDNGTPFTLGCSANHVLVGVTVRTTNNGGWITGIAARCAPIDLGDIFVTPFAGSALLADMSESTTMCPAGLAVVGFEGNTGLYVDKIALRCR